MSDFALENRLLHYVMVNDIQAVASILCHMEEQGHISSALPATLLCRAKTVPMLRVLICHGIHGETALMYFADRERFNRQLALELLALKVNINAQSAKTEDTALIIAVRSHSHDMETLLMEAGAALHLRNGEGLTAEEMAFIVGNYEFRRNFCHHQ